MIGLLINDINHQLLELLDADEEVGIGGVEGSRLLPADVVTAQVQVDRDSLLETVTHPRLPLGQRVELEAAETSLQSLGYCLKPIQQQKKFVEDLARILQGPPASDNDRKEENPARKPSRT